MRCPRCQHLNQDDSRFCADCGEPLGRSSPSPDAEVTKTLSAPPVGHEWPPGRTLAGKYTILGELGKGGMGEVYLAEDTTLDRKVALKFLPEAAYRNPAMRARFVSEAKAAAALDHPYICSIHEVGETEGKLFFVMEFIAGRTLRDRLQAGPLPCEEALRAAAEIAEALQAAHEKGIIHRDIKPANIMLTGEGHAKVMDFGLAKHYARPDGETAASGPAGTVTGENATPGTPAYMSPEQVRGKELDPRSDIFSFGIVLYEMLSGRHPFKKDTGLTTMSAILSEEPPPITGVADGLPEGIRILVDRMLAKEPGDRYASMADVLAALRDLIASLQGAKAWFKPVRLALTAAVLCVTVLGAAWLARELFFKTPAKALAFQARDWILITDFENHTGEPVFDAGLETALTVSIQQSQYVNVFPPARIQETLRRMQRTGVARIDEAVGREIALRGGIKGMLVCAIGKVGGDYLLTARLVDPDKQTAVFSDSTRTKRADDILACLDDLAKKVRHGLGESMGRIAARQLGLVRATTASFEALKYYSAARRASGEMILQLLKQALELDPEFALAHVETGVRYYIASDRVKGEEHFEKALSLMDRLTMREKLWIRALIEDWRGNRDEGIRNYMAYLAEYPDDSAAWFRLAYARMVSGEYEPAIEAFKNVVEIDKESANAKVNIATCFNSLNNTEEALKYYQQSFALNPDLETGNFTNHEYGFLLVRMGKIDDAERTFLKMTGVSDKWRKPRGFRSLGLLEMYRGRYEAAEENFQEAVRINVGLKAGLSEFRDRIFLAIVLLKRGRIAAFEKEVAAAEKANAETKVEPFFLARLGTLYARAGKVREAERIMDSLKARLGDLLAASGIARSNQTDQASFERLKGEVELAKGRIEEAMASFASVASLRELQLEDALALAYFKSGDIDKAIGAYQAFIEQDVLGGEAQESWVLAHYRLGMLFEKKGDRAEAAKCFGRFLEIWKDADPGMPEVADARHRLAGLG